MKSNNTLRLGLIILIALLVSAAKGGAQVPCGPTTIPNLSRLVNWPQYLHDPAHTGCNPYESILSPSTVGNLTTKWQHAMGEFQMLSSSVLANGVVYFGSTPDNINGFLNAADASTGNLIWSHNIGYGTISTPAVVNGIIYIGAEQGIYAISSGGATVWYFPTPQAVAASPVIVNGVLYVESLDGTLFALNASTGAVIWQDGNALSQGSYSSPAVFGGVVYVGSFSDYSVYAFNASTGALLWKYATEGEVINSSPAVANGKVYIGSEGNMYALDAKTGALVWKYPAGWVYGSPAVARGIVYFGTLTSNFYAVNGATGAPLWSLAMGGNGFSAAVANGVVYAVMDPDEGGPLYAVDANTGAVLWKSADINVSSPAVANGVIYSMSRINLNNFALTAYHLQGQ